MNVADMAKVLNHLRRDTVVKVKCPSFAQQCKCCLVIIPCVESILLLMLDEIGWLDANMTAV